MLTGARVARRIAAYARPVPYWSLCTDYCPDSPGDVLYVVCILPV